jgi:hypothetical protein
MRKVPTYWFDNLLSTGIDEVPEYSQVLVEDDGAGSVRVVYKVDNGTLDESSTIGDFLADGSLYQEAGALAAEAVKLQTARTISLSGDASGSISFDGSSDEAINVVIADDSHSHDGQYLAISGATMTGALTLNGVPTSDLHAATKKYVDDAITGGGTTTEDIQDTVGAMVSGNTETGISVTYQDSDGTLDFQVLDDGHTHDNRYYTETESDGRFVSNTSDTMTGTLTVNEISDASISGGTF